jgi:hypothetical protein
MESFLIIAIVLGTFVFICIIAAIAMVFLFFIFSHASGWAALARFYGVMSEPVQTVYKKQTIKVGGVRWRFTATVGIGQWGLYLAVNPFRWPLSRFVQHPPLLIPWANIKVVGMGNIYLMMPAMVLSIGNPEITLLSVTREIYDTMVPYLGNATV